MSQKLLPQLALLVLVLLCSLQSGILQTDTIAGDLANIKATITSMHGSMVEFRAEVKSNINSLREDLNCLKDSVSNLSMCLQQHKKQTETELADLHTSLPSTQTNFTSQLAQLQTSLDSTQTNFTSQLDVLQTSLDSTQTNFTSQLDVLQTSLDSAQTNFTSQLDVLQTSLDSTQTNHNRLINIKMDSLEECLSEHKEQVTGKLNTLQTSQANHTSQLLKIQDCVTYLKIIHGPYTCGGTGGWRRVVYLDMTDPSTTCPSGWKLTGYSKRTCGRATDGTNTCDSATFPVRRGEYSRICGRIRAYQWGSPDAFVPYHTGRITTIDGAYVDSVSVTHGTPRNHIWTFAAGLSENHTTRINVCPCDTNIRILVPAFVGEDYFCESGLHKRWTGASGQFKFYPSDTLWDGDDCLPSSTCCSRGDPPYFVKQLPTTTTDDIEARICLDEVASNEDIAVELVELYVQ